MKDLYIAFLFALVSTIILGPFIIKKLTDFKFGQNVRLDGPESHLKKQGIPSMGGIMFILTSAIVSLIVSRFDSRVILIVFVMISFAAIGFIDDFLIVKKESADGLSAKIKMLLLIIVSTVISLILYNKFNLSSLRLPLLNIELELNVFYIAFVVIFFAAVTNAVNLTDGIDGLSSTVSIIVLIFFLLVTIDRKEIEMSIFIISLIGALIGFLSFNKFPAKVFMGDTGSLALGSVIGILALLNKMEITLIFVGIIYVIETLSVIIQVIYFKKTGKRVFKMAPIHHHFEAVGWRENKIVFVFALITFVAVIIAFVLYLLT